MQQLRIVSLLISLVIEFEKCRSLADDVAFYLALIDAWKPLFVV